MFRKSFFPSYSRIDDLSNITLVKKSTLRSLRALLTQNCPEFEEISEDVLPKKAALKTTKIRPY